MNFDEYWVGKDIDLENIWEIFDKGKGYIEKYKSMEVYVLRFQFDSSLDLPLFDQEAISKTIKSVFHELKKECLSQTEYKELGPIFLYEINRGSAIWTFLAELKPAILMITGILRTGLLWRKFIGQGLDNDNKRIDKIKKMFPNASGIDIQDYLNAWTFIGQQKVLKRLSEQGLKKIEISKEPFTGQKDIEVTDISIIEEDN